MSKLRVAFVSQPWSGYELPLRHSDSIAIWTYEVANRLTSDADIAIYCKRFSNQAWVERDRGIEYRRLISPKGERIEKSIGLLTRRVGIPATRVFKKEYLQSLYAIAVALDLKRRGTDVIHVHNFSEFVLPLRKFNPRAQIVLHMHCEWLSQIPERDARRRLAAVDRVVGCSQHVVDMVNRRYPEFADRVKVLYNGADVGMLDSTERAESGDATETPKRGPNILFVGRVSPEKGLHDLVDAFELVLEKVPDATLTIAGPTWTTRREWIVDLSDDPLVQGLARFYRGNEDYQSQLLARMKPSTRERVEFLGQVARQDLIGYYRGTDVLVNPSLSEAFGMSLVEAQVCAKPVVATRVGGMTELVRDGESGFLVPPQNPGALADALTRILQDPDMRRRMGETGQADTVRRFSWERIAKDTLAHYHEMRSCN